MSRAAEVMTLLLEAEAALPEDVRVPGPASEAEIAGFEERTGVPIPPHAREWLLHRNGSPVGQGGLYGLPQMERNYEWHPFWRQQGWLPVAGDGCGDTYVLETRPVSGPQGVYFIEHESDQSRLEYGVASGLWPFIQFILLGEKQQRDWNQACDALDELEDDAPEYPDEPEGRWPFDRDYVTALDPDIVQCTGGPLPWNADQHWNSRDARSG